CREKVTDEKRQILPECAEPTHVCAEHRLYARNRWVCNRIRYRQRNESCARNLYVWNQSQFLTLTPQNDEKVNDKKSKRNKHNRHYTAGHWDGIMRRRLAGRKSARK